MSVASPAGIGTRAAGSPGVRGRITGTFVDFSELTHKDHALLRWSERDWQEELGDMRRAGIESVILARTLRFGCAYYYSDFFETHEETDYLTPFMRAASAVGMSVYLSGMLSEHFFTAGDEDFARMMKRDLRIYETVISELLGAWGDHPGLSGIYISHEPDNRNLASPARLAAARGFFGTLYERLKSRCTLPVLCSPFFTKDVTPAGLARFWDGLLDRPMFDIIAMQDGVGCDRDITPEDIPAYYGPLREVFARKGIAFWNNVETFSFHPGFRRSGNDRSKIWLHPAPPGRVDRQYRAGAPFVEATIMWEYGHFLSRKQVGEDWYESFRAWNAGATEEERPSA